MRAGGVYDYNYFTGKKYESKRAGRCVSFSMQFSGENRGSDSDTEEMYTVGIGKLYENQRKLAGQAFMDIQEFDMEKTGTAALLTYDGLVFKHTEAVLWKKDDLEYAQNHLRILSACYGSLKPLDAIHPYRLEMQCKIPIDGQNLYAFWGEDIYRDVYRDNSIVLNLASEEYAKCVRKYAKYDRFIDVEFLNMHKGKLKTLATLAKMARGHIVQYIMKKRIDTPEEIKAFDWNGYKYESSLSDERKIVFISG